MSRYKDNLVNTYSIVARDDKTGEMGVGVQSHWFSVGSVVSWGKAGIGVVATQAMVNISYGPRGLDLLEKGETPDRVINLLLEDDDGRDLRQVAILNSQGLIANYTGKKCIKHAGHLKGKNYSVQANMMLNDTVWSAMAKSYELNKNLPLAERILKTLYAAEQEGGDIRGKQSATILIVAGKPTENRWEDPILDLRVEDHKEPLKELSRLLQVYRAYEHMNKGDLAIEENKMDIALKEYASAQELFPDNPEMKFWTAVSLANSNKIDEALRLFLEIFKVDNNWRILLKRLPEAGILNINSSQLDKILSL
ncbi:MAG: DUF1028 domain-containing protein [Candidatus Thorarchaeota archaeon]